MKEKSIVKYLTEKQESFNDEFEKLFYLNIGPAFVKVDSDISNMRHSEYMLKGGRGSLKSSFISLEIIKLLSKTPRGSALVLRKVGATMRDTVYAQMLWAIDTLRQTDNWICTVSPMKMINKRTKQEIMFRGLDDPRKIKSIKPRRGYFKAVWFEEGEEYDGYHEIRNVMQSAGRGKRADAVCFISYNPPKSANNWINKESQEKKEGRLVHHSSYLEAPREWLGERFIREAEELKSRNELAYRHEYLGEAVGTGGNVFNNLTIRKISAEDRAMMKKLLYGLDFGYSTDPSALMTCYYEENDKRLFVLKEYYKGGAGFDALESECKKATVNGGQIWCDTEPRTIAELHQRGCHVAAARKGRKSRVFGMMWLENLREIVIDPLTCPNAAREFTGFEHVRDPVTNEFRADYMDGNDHTIDAVRYALWPYIHRNNRKKFYSGKGARI